jgi:hypothetical protein
MENSNEDCKRHYIISHKGEGKGKIRPGIGHEGPQG